MEKSKKIAKAVMVSLVSASIAGTAVSAIAGSKYIKCYGVAKKGKNDCGNKRHSCAGQAKSNNASDEWIYAKKEDCTKKGGSVGKPKKS